MDFFQNTYQRLFHPKSIAVIGASNDYLKPGGRVTKNIKDNNYTGELWAVNPKTPDVLNLPTFQKISDLPGIPDLAIIAIPARFVLPTLQDLADKGVTAVIVMSAGFGEKDVAGKAMEQEMLILTEKHGMALVGPNCSGFLTPTYKGKFAGIIPTIPGGAVDFISGSGATVDYVMEHASTRGLSFGTVINLGNSIQLGVEDLLEMYDQNYNRDNSHILMLYMEAIKKPGKLLRHARSLVGKGCALVGIKSGATAAGQRAAESHTGAMATSDTAVEALFSKAGIIRVQSRVEMIDVASVLAVCKGCAKGKRVCVITDAGGPGVMLSDELNRQGMVLPELLQVTRDRLAEILPPESSTINPIDALPSRSAEQIRDIINVLKKYEHDRIDIITVLAGDSGMSDNTAIYKEIAAAMEDTPIAVLPMFSSLVSSQEKLSAFTSQGRVFFPDEVAMGWALGKVTSWISLETTAVDLKHYNKEGISEIVSGTIGALTPLQVRQVLEAAGFRVPKQAEAYNLVDLSEACKHVGFPLVMKVIGPLHKTDVGGVVLGIDSLKSASVSWSKLMGIPDAQGVLIQPVISGTEVILGACREGDFGHLLMFGLGGIYAEVLKDVSFALAPVSPAESQRMIHGIQSYGVIKGARGESGMDENILADYIQRLGCLVADFPEIREIDLNPVKGVGSELFAVDARIIVEN
ncbi:MAG: CoA-binding protein [Desulfobulbaceae bacterium]|nr:CoA-binding protein [Desulfobulbaceae bacterium]